MHKSRLSSIKTDRKTEPIIIGLTELMTTAVNQTKMETLTFQQSVTCDKEGGRTAKERHSVADTCGNSDHPSTSTNLQQVIRQTAGNAPQGRVAFHPRFAHSGKRNVKSRHIFLLIGNVM
jgi:hypothetical protein